MRLVHLEDLTHSQVISMVSSLVARRDTRESDWTSFALVIVSSVLLSHLFSRWWMSEGRTGEVDSGISRAMNYSNDLFCLPVPCWHQRHRYSFPSLSLLTYDDHSFTRVLLISIWDEQCRTLITHFDLIKHKHRDTPDIYLMRWLDKYFVLRCQAQSEFEDRRIVRIRSWRGI